MSAKKDLRMLVAEVKGLEIVNEENLECLKTTVKNMELIQLWFEQARGQTSENSFKICKRLLENGRYVLNF